ncbi:glycosyltransferase family 4 protein [Mucilaginibacter litoreus]|uniref:Glycosyltransferase family 4 protein n=1 Tax=Mucilaginibacter litoreus TaxID=1048221 RepID=A0ABW3AXI8_9SPHI
MKKLAIITTHPIQYYAPVFKLLQQYQRIQIRVFYTWGEASVNKHDPGFNRTVNWDIDLLSGYDYEWVTNTATDAGSHHFNGIINPTLIEQLYKFKPDALLLFGWAYHSHLKVLRHFKNKLPILFRGDSTLLDEKPGIKSILRKIYLRFVYKHIDYALYTGTNNKHYFKKYGLTNAQLVFAPHAVDNNRFAIQRHNEASDFRIKLGINTDDILVLYAGKFEGKKDPLLLLKAFLRLNKPNVHLLFTGNGPLEILLKQHADGHANVHFMGFQNQSCMPVVYQACNVFCLPSKGPAETWGLAVNEAMACGKAVLVSDKVGCAIDLVKGGYNGAVFNSGDENDLFNQLSSLTISAGYLDQLGSNSATLIKDWSFTKLTRSIENLLIDEKH